MHFLILLDFAGTLRYCPEFLIEFHYFFRPLLIAQAAHVLHVLGCGISNLLQEALVIKSIDFCC